MTPGLTQNEERGTGQGACTEASGALASGMYFSLFFFSLLNDYLVTLRIRNGYHSDGEWPPPQPNMTMTKNTTSPLPVVTSNVAPSVNSQPGHGVEGNLNFWEG